MLDLIKREYNIGPKLYEEIRQSLKFQCEGDMSDIMEFIQDLQPKLKDEITYEIHKETIRKMPFFQAQEIDFISYIGSMLKPEKKRQDIFLFRRGDPLDKLYFVESGVVGYVLVNRNNLVYSIAEIGDVVGLSDFQKGKEDTVLQTKRKQDALCLSPWNEFMSLECDDFLRLENEFPEVYTEMLQNSYILNMGLKKTKYEAMKRIRTTTTYHMGEHKDFLRKKRDFYKEMGDSKKQAKQKCHMFEDRLNAFMSRQIVRDIPALKDFIEDDSLYEQSPGDGNSTTRNMIKMTETSFNDSEVSFQRQATTIKKKKVVEMPDYAKRLQEDIEELKKDISGMKEFISSEIKGAIREALAK